MECISAVKLIKFILNVSNNAFLGVFMPKNRLLPGLRSGDRLLPKKSTFVFGFRLQLLALGGYSSPFVTPISGYAYVRVSNNKQ